MRTRRTVTGGLGPLFVALLIGSLLVLSPGAAIAQSSLIVINEVHYHPATDPDPLNAIDDLEFLELHNPSASAVDITGWSIADAVTVTFGAVSIPAGGYVIISPDIALATATYGVVPVAEYPNKLSNGGETITLLDATLSAVDTVTYDDIAPWPVTADGDGPSLELRDPAADNNDAANWAASNPAPTPGAVNTALPVTGAISGITVTPAAPTAADTVEIRATVDGAVAPSLTYKVAWGADVALPMSDLGGGVFSATVPAQADGELVRYRIDDGALSYPVPGDTIDYEGYVVADPGVNTQLPDFRWFIDPADFTDMITNHLLDDMMFPSVIAYNGTVYDGVQVRIRGGDTHRINFPKKSFEVEFPTGHDFIAPDLLSYPVDQFALNTNWTDRRWGNNEATWNLFGDAGFPEAHNFAVHLEQNGSFFGMYQFMEKLDGEWRDGAGLVGGEFYKSDGSGFLGNWGWKVKVPDGGSQDPVVAVGVELRKPPSATKTQYMYDTWDIPNLVNYLAVSTIAAHHDQRHHNYYVFHDIDDTGRWQMYPWDLDNTWENDGGLCTGDPMADLSCVASPIIDSILEIPALDAMVWRRIRSLLDGPAAPVLIEDNHTTHILRIGADAALENAAWGRGDAGALAAGFRNFVANRRNIMETEPRVPASQAVAPTIVINELLPSPAVGQAEILELYNPGADWVDLSGWTIDGVGLTIPGGTVIGPNGYVVFTDELALFDATTSLSDTVVVQYPGGLKGAGETVTLSTPDLTVVDQVSYVPATPWPAVAEGFTYALADPTLDNADGAAWVVSAVAGGTPGTANGVVRPALKPGGAGVVEGHTGTRTVNVPIKLSAPLAVDLTFSYETIQGTGPGLATENDDYVPTSGTLTILAGSTTGVVPITVNGDTLDEPPLLWGEWGLVRFFDVPVNAAFDLSFFGVGIFVIIDDDV